MISSAAELVLATLYHFQESLFLRGIRKLLSILVYKFTENKKSLLCDSEFGFDTVEKQLMVSK